MAEVCLTGPPHWRQTQPLLRSNRAGVRWLSHRLWTRREESPGQSKVGGIAAKTSLDQLFVQYKCTVMGDINGHYLQLPLFSLQGFPLYMAHQIGRAFGVGEVWWLGLPGSLELVGSWTVDSSSNWASMQVTPGHRLGQIKMSLYFQAIIF